MSTPGHHYRVVLIGHGREAFTDGSVAVIGVILRVEAKKP
jgi:hypothetical protein